VEPLAGGLVDHLLRGSVALPLTARLEILIADANRAAGIRHSIFGEPSNRGIVGLNPGVAIGRLGIISSAEDNQTVDPKRIYVIPQTLADLEPMAGILTLDSGNVLSHSQLLAANLGIPNATVPSALLPALREKGDVELFYAVTRGGVVILKEKASMAPEEIERWVGRTSANRVRLGVDTSKLRLTDTRLIPLTELTAQDSGSRAGPKAANLGQLTHFFPRNVAPGLVVPFGIYYAHIHRSIDDGPPLDEQIARMYRRAEQLRDSGASSADVNVQIYPELARIRKVIQTMPLLPAFEKELAARMRETFGPDGSYGVFVRSDTNAEDLPEFTGAGLNLTVPNQVGFRHVTQSLKDVWASPFEERAWDWRSRILKSSEHVYPSVLLLRSVPSDKSGVIATVNLETGEDDITVNVSEGVSAVVDGGVAESLLLKPDGRVRLLDQARGTYRKMLRPSGDFQNVPVSGSDTVLMPDEIRQLREMVAEVKRRYPPAYAAQGDALPWDIEFGFEKGQLRLFQIRPLARYQEQQTLEALSRLDASEKPSEKVRLDGTP
jgi:phosphoenolpyruvate synthase/pyruvate phosphate dikinase